MSGKLTKKVAKDPGAAKKPKIGSFTQKGKQSHITKAVKYKK